MIKTRLEKLRDLMKKHDVQVYLVPSTDPHQSEYVPDLWQRRQWLSGFTGSAGDLAIAQKSAGLWTDSRYFLQAEKELDGSGITLFKMGMPGVPTLENWLKTELGSGETVGYDPRLFTDAEVKKLEFFLKNHDIELKSIEQNLVDAIWENQPVFPSEPVQPHPAKYSGESVEGKLKRLRQDIAEEGTTAHVLTTLDSIAWLYNIRGKDVEFNPVVISYAIVTDKKAMLFTPLNKVSEAVKSHLNGWVELYEYDDFRTELINLAKSETKVWLDSGTISRWVADLLASDCELIFKSSPVTLYKAVKNETELAGLRAAHVRDGVAMVNFLHWLENAVPAGSCSEISVAEKLEHFRREQDFFQGLSFATISGYNEHGAIVHYSATPESDVELKPEGIFLIDSGGQYLDGTTDITRTVALCTPDEEQKDRFTRVLKGHIRLAMAGFPRGTAGNQLDTIARKPLWDIGLNYGHGTGHGIGSYLNVHEGPHAISYYRGIGVELKPGMVISNEPGYYKAGEYGIRIENLIVTEQNPELTSDEFEFYRFETVTLCPIDLKLIDKSMLTEKEIQYLNDYHKQVREKLSPYLESGVKDWLERATRAI